MRLEEIRPMSKRRDRVHADTFMAICTVKGMDIYMDEFRTGGYAVATAGHDSGKCYVIILSDEEYVYLVDGRIRTIDRPKKKKKKHVKMLAGFDPVLADKVLARSVINEEIKRAIKSITTQ